MTDNFPYSELTASYDAARLGLDNKPDAKAQSQLKRLALYFLEPIRAATGHVPLIVSSGYRSAEVNKQVGGSKSSYHLHGCAADIKSKAMPPLELCRLIENMALPFDELIHEFGGWCHIAMPLDPFATPKRLVSTIYYDDKKMVVKQSGLIEIPRG